MKQNTRIVERRRVKCPKCSGTMFYSGKYGQTACEECFDGYVWLKELNKKMREKRREKEKKNEGISFNKK